MDETTTIEADEGADAPVVGMTAEEKEVVARRSYNALQLASALVGLANEAKEISLELLQGTGDPKALAERVLVIQRAMRNGMNERIEPVLATLYREDLRINNVREDEYGWIQRQNFALSRKTIAAREQAAAEAAEEREPAGPRM